MTHFCTYVRDSAQLEFCLKTPLEEIILEHRFLSRLGGPETEKLLNLLELWTDSGRSALLQWDLLHNESELSQAVQVLEKLPLHRFSAIRVQDLGAANWLRKTRPELKLHWIVEGSNHNLKGLLRWYGLLIPQLQRLVLSTELPGKMLQHCIRDLKVGCEILGLGSMLMFYTPRRLISALNETKTPDQNDLDVWAAFNDTPHRKFRTLENSHGTFLFHDRDLFLLDRLPQLSEWGLEAFRLDLRRVSIEWLSMITEADLNDQKQIKNLRRKWPFRTSQGFFRANHTDRALQRMKNPFLITQEESPVAVVLESIKQQHLALHIKRPFQCGSTLWSVTPEGRILEISVTWMTNLQSKPLSIAQTDQVVLIPHSKFVTSQSLVYVRKPSLSFFR